MPLPTASLAPAAPSAPMRELLAWTARCPRTYVEAREAWGSHCPRFTVWEDALDAGLVQVEHGQVVLTAPGRAALAAD